MSTRTALVTGANRGIGAEVAAQLGAAGFEVLVGARRPQAAEPIVRRIVGAGGAARAVRLDVTREEDVSALRAELSSLEVLVNNAAVALDGFDAEVVRATLAVNVHGARRVTVGLWDLLEPGARVVNVSSGVADRGSLKDDLRARFEGAESESELFELLEEFARLVNEGRHADAGWPSSAYRASKLALNELTRIWQAEAKAAGRDLVVCSVCPGWVRTDMGGQHAPRGVAEGADTIVWAARSEDPRHGGGFFRDRAPAAW